MRRRVPSFRNELAQENKNGSPSVMHWINQTVRSLKKCGIFLNSTFQLFFLVQYVRLHSIPTFMLLYHYKPPTACVSEVEQIEAKVNSKIEKRSRAA
jgi:hypothetical protein